MALRAMKSVVVFPRQNAFESHDVPQAFQCLVGSSTAGIEIVDGSSQHGNEPIFGVNTPLLSGDDLLLEEHCLRIEPGQQSIETEAATERGEEGNDHENRGEAPCDAEIAENPDEKCLHETSFSN